MIQETSREARAKVSPHIGRAQREILSFISTRVNATNREIAKGLGWEINRVTPRVLELRAMGRVIEAGRRNDMETGRRSIAWTYVVPAKTGQPTLF